MSVRFIHTADWHLGQLFHQHSRYKEHDYFLQQLLDYIDDYQPHALLIAGDIFDVVNPPAQAQKQLYQFLNDAHQRAKNMQILMIAGNHDSGYRIEQVNPLLDKYHAKAVGVIQWLNQNDDEQLDFEHLIIPIYDEHQAIIAWCVALPFLRSAEITGHKLTDSDPMIASEKLYQILLQEVQKRCEPHQVIIMMTHAHLQGGVESPDSERPIIIGYQEALSIQHFIEQADYVALGHLHKAQKVQYDYIRYSGSPIPLSFSEMKYHHQVMLIEFDETKTMNLTALPIQKQVELYTLTGDIEHLFEQITQLEQGEIDDVDLRHFLNIEYESQDIAQPDLRQKIEQALPKNRYRLVRLARKIKSQQSSHQPSEQKMNIEPPTPLQLFQMIWQKNYDNLSRFDEQVMRDFQYLERLALEQYDEL